MTHSSHESDPLNPELSQEALSHAWHELSEALVIYGDHPQAITGEYPPTPESTQPYQFSRQIPAQFIKDHLLLSTGNIAGTGVATHMTKYSIDPIPDLTTEVFETTSIAWTEKIPGTYISSDNRIMIRRVQYAGQEAFFSGRTFREYSELNSEGDWKRVSSNAHTYPDQPERITIDDIVNSFEDYETHQGELDLACIDKFHKVSDYIRQNPRTLE